MTDTGVCERCGDNPAPDEPFWIDPPGPNRTEFAWLCQTCQVRLWHELQPGCSEVGDA